MILCKNLVPDIYTESEDFLSVLRLLDLVANKEYQMNKLSKMYNPISCSYDRLPALAKYMGYDYDTSIPISDNRIIMYAFPLMIKNKGSITGIQIAIKTSTKLSDHKATVTSGHSPFQVVINRSTSTIKIAIKCIKFSKKLRELIEYVRPAGYRVEIGTLENASLEVANPIEVSMYSDNIFKPCIVLSPLRGTELIEVFNDFDVAGNILYWFVLPYKENVTISNVTINTKVLTSNSKDASRDIKFTCSGDNQTRTMTKLKIDGTEENWTEFGDADAGYGLLTGGEGETVTGQYQMYKIKLNTQNTNDRFIGFSGGLIEITYSDNSKEDYSLTTLGK